MVTESNSSQKDGFNSKQIYTERQTILLLKEYN